LLPATLGKVSRISYAVSGATANNYDDIADLHSRVPLVLAVVAVLAFILLLVAFRSIAIPLVSIGLNLLSVGAAYGLITLIFQDGRLQDTLGYTGFGAVVSWVPLFLFVFLFGMSMDYHVFILSRIRELRSRGAGPKEAVISGIASSAGVVTSAAVIMVAVFSILATLSIVQLKMLGVGLAAAVLIDATVVAASSSRLRWPCLASARGTCRGGWPGCLLACPANGGAATTKPARLAPFPCRSPMAAMPAGPKGR
jgi:RND superfamily putative drug exporter